MFLLALTTLTRLTGKIWRLLLSEEYNNPEDIALKKALVAIFKDHEYHRELSLKQIKKMGYPYLVIDPIEL